MLETQRKMATKAFYAALGAPVVAGRKLREYGTKVAEHSGKWADEAQSQYDEFAKEGESFTTKLKERNVVERFFARIKHYRGLATRYEKTVASYLALFQLACIKSYLL